MSPTYTLDVSVSLESSCLISIAVAFNFATLITFFVANLPPKSPFRLVMIYPDTVVVNILACRVFRNVKFGRHSQVLIMPPQINIGNLTQHNYIPDTGRENAYHIGDMNILMPVQVSRQKQLPNLPIPDSHREGIKKPNNYLGEIEVTKVIELTPSFGDLSPIYDIGSTTTGSSSRPY